MNIACVTAHPDDAEILCAGTMIKYIQKGHHVTFIIATNGEVGSPTLPNEEIAQIRYEEAKEGARIVGAELIWLGIPDEFLFNNNLAIFLKTFSCISNTIFNLLYSKLMISN